MGRIVVSFYSFFTGSFCRFAAFGAALAVAIATLMVISNGCGRLGGDVPRSIIIKNDSNLPCVIPFEFRDNQYLFQVKIDNSAPYIFLLDTGSSVVWISDRMCNELRLNRVRGKDRVTTAFGTKPPVDHVAIDSMSLGGAEFRGLKSEVLPQKELLGNGIEGIISFPLLCNRIWTLDGPQRKLTIWPTKDVPSFISQGAVAVRLDLNHGLPFAPIRLVSKLHANEDLKALVDTGNASIFASIMLPRSKRYLAIPRGHPLFAEFRFPVPSDRMSQGIFNRIDATIELGRYSFATPMVGWSDLPTFGTSLTAGLLINYAITFDCGHRIVYLNGPTRGSRPP